MRYIDSSRRDPTQTVAHWITGLEPAEIQSLRIQSGYFTAEPIVLLEPILTHLASVGAPVSIIIGSNNQETAAEDVLDLFSILGPPRPGLRVGVIAFQGGLFHSKVLHFGTNAGPTVYVGSANLTGPGVTGQNVESGLILAATDGDSIDLIDSIGELVDDWFAGSQGALRLVNGPDDIGRLLEEGMLAERAVLNQRREARQSETGEKRPDLPRIRRLVQLPQSRRGRTAIAPPPSDVVAKTGTSGELLPTSAAWQLMWQSNGLSRRDLNIPTGDSTHATGSMGLKRGDWDAEIDHRHYFRDDVFSGLEWRTVGGGHRQTATASVELWINGVEQATADVPLTHNGDTTSETYLQRNFMTSLRWGDLRPYVANEALLGHILRLDRLEVGGGRAPRYRIRIDED